MMDVPNNCVAFVTGWGSGLQVPDTVWFRHYLSDSTQSLSGMRHCLFLVFASLCCFSSSRLWRKLPARVRGGRSHARGSCD